MLKFTSLIISSGNSQELTKFYEGVFEKPVDPMMGWKVGEFYLGVMDHSEVHGKNPNGPRIMFHLEAEDVPAEFDRIKDIEGAEVIKAPYQMTMEGKIVPEGEETEDGFWLATLADPDGNYFQLMSPWDPSSMSN
jgi:predicted enzyme related to lactoylglutathione lyase